MPVFVCPLKESEFPVDFIVGQTRVVMQHIPVEGISPFPVPPPGVTALAAARENALKGALAVPSTAELDGVVATLRSEITQNVNSLRESDQQLKNQLEQKFSETTLAALQKLPSDVKDLLKPLLMAEIKAYIDQKFDELREQLPPK